MKGLEITVRPFSQVQDEHLFFRIDSEHCQKAFLANIARIKKCPNGFARLGDELEEMTGGATPLGANYPEDGVRFLRVQNIMPGYIDDSDMTHISAKDDEELSRSRLQTDDVLLTITGVSYGKAAAVTPEFAESNINQHSVRMRFRSGDFRPVFIATFLNAAPGKLQSDQNITGVTRPALDYTTIRNFLLPCVSDSFQEAIENEVRRAYQCFSKSKQAMARSEQTLLRALGLEGWHPPEPLTYTRRASEAFAAGRLDSDYFSPRVADLLRLLGANELTIRDVAPPRHEQFIAGGTGEFEYLEISGVRSDGTAISERMLRSEAPSRATWHVQAGDVITSTVRPIRRLSAIITPEQNDFVCSSGFVVLQPAAVSPELLLTYLRLPPVCELMDLHTSASLYPAISERDLLRLPFRRVNAETEAEIVRAIQGAHTARRAARELLERAKRAVEIAIEENETVALRYLDQRPE